MRGCQFVLENVRECGWEWERARGKAKGTNDQRGEGKEAAKAKAKSTFPIGGPPLWMRSGFCEVRGLILGQALLPSTLRAASRQLPAACRMPLASCGPPRAEPPRDHDRLRPSLQAGTGQGGGRQVRHFTGRAAEGGSVRC
jgi:hypothetical protein